MAADAVSGSQLPLSSSHRLPTLSATEALQKLRSAPSKTVSTGLPRLDALLSKERLPLGDASEPKGLRCGSIAEVYGPPGSGKTGLCLQAAASSLSKGHDVIWIDCGTKLPIDRLKKLLQSYASHETTTEQLQEQAARFHYYSAADLAHLLTMFIYPAPDFAGDNTALIVIDSISTVFEVAYSRVHDRQSKQQSESAKWIAARKYAVMGDLISRLQKLATMSNLAVLLTQQTRMRIRSGAGALLLPALSSVEWDNGVPTQLVLFRDFAPIAVTQSNPEMAERWNRLRYVGVIKIHGVSSEENGRFDTVVPFSIEKDGLSELPAVQADVTVPVLSSPARTSKRRFEEIADSEDEELRSDDDYGFDEDVDFEIGLVDLTTAA